MSYLIARRRLLAGVVGTGLGLLLAACGAPSAQPSPTATAKPATGAQPAPATGKPSGSAPVTLRLHARLGPEDDMWAQVPPKFEQAHNVKVQLKQVSGHVERKLQTLAAGDSWAT